MNGLTSNQLDFSVHPFDKLMTGFDRLRANGKIQLNGSGGLAGLARAATGIPA